MVGRRLTHAVQTKGIFQLISSPCCSDGICFVGEVGCYVFGDASGGKEGSVEVEGDDCF